MELLAELQDALRIFRNCSHDERLRFCNISEATLAADCRNESIPWVAVGLHYYCLAIRAVRARAVGRFPDGSPWGSDNPSAITPPYLQILKSKQPEDT
jgi:hypothetical protein